MSLMESRTLPWSLLGNSATTIVLQFSPNKKCTSTRTKRVSYWAHTIILMAFERFLWPLLPRRLCPLHPRQCLLWMPLFARTWQKPPLPNICTDVAAALSSPHGSEPYKIETLSLGRASILYPSTSTCQKASHLRKGVLLTRNKRIYNPPSQ
jgi:hypothetical protein